MATFTVSVKEKHPMAPVRTVAVSGNEITTQAQAEAHILKAEPRYILATKVEPAVAAEIKPTSESHPSPVEPVVAAPIAAPVPHQ
jgi:hypothetical protein